jgi:predicted lipoprotein with Yx(FWY)xxD motif
MRRRVAALAAGVALSGLTLAGCGGSAHTTTPTTVRTPPGDHPSTTDVRVGSALFLEFHTHVLVDASDYPLYIYVPDHHEAVTCQAACATTWPPLAVASRSAVHAGPGVAADLIGADRAPDGALVVTYDHWPLYTYAEDPQPGFATGQGLDVDGGYWYLLRPDGRPLLTPS